jgi:hypothetical protein
MGENRPLPLTTCLSKLGAAGRKLVSLGLVQGLLRSIPGLPTAALAGVVILFFVWSCERQARRREAVQAQQVKKQAAEEISGLQQQAAGALRDAKQSAQAVRKLEAQRQQLVREAEGLRQSLESLRKQELARIDEVATLPTSEVASRVAARLEEQVSGARGQMSGQQGSVSGARGQMSGQQGSVSGVGGQVSGRPPLNPLTRPALAEEQVSGVGGQVPGQRGSVSGAGGQGAGPAPNAPSASSPALVLSDQGVRKVEAALIELDSCRQQTQVMGQQVSNCEQQSKLESALRDQQSAMITKLNAALADKDKILAASEAAHRAELKAARGTWRSHFVRAVEYFAGGFIAGVLVR